MDFIPIKNWCWFWYIRIHVYTDLSTMSFVLYRGKKFDPELVNGNKHYSSILYARTCLQHAFTSNYEIVCLNIHRSFTVSISLHGGLRPTIDLQWTTRKPLHHRVAPIYSSILKINKWKGENETIHRGKKFVTWD